MESAHLADKWLDRVYSGKDGILTSRIRLGGSYVLSGNTVGEIYNCNDHLQKHLQNIAYNIG